MWEAGPIKDSTPTKVEKVLLLASRMEGTARLSLGRLKNPGPKALLEGLLARYPTLLPWYRSSHFGFSTLQICG